MPFDFRTRIDGKSEASLHNTESQCTDDEQEEAAVRLAEVSQGYESSGDERRYLNKSTEKVHLGRPGNAEVTLCGFPLEELQQLPAFSIARGKQTSCLKCAKSR